MCIFNFRGIHPIFYPQVDGNCSGVINTEFRGQYSGVSEFEMTPTVDGTGTVNLTFSENIMADDFYTVTITVEHATVLKLSERGLVM